MKILALLSLLCFISLSSFSQERTRGVNVPGDVMQKFDRDFPDAGPENWQMLSSDLYVAKFRLNGFVQRAHYNSFGAWQYTDIEISEEHMPAAAMEHYRSTYSQYPIMGTGLHDASNSYFFIEIMRRGVKRKLKYDEEGNFIQ